MICNLGDPVSLRHPVTHAMNLFFVRRSDGKKDNTGGKGSWRIKIKIPACTHTEKSIGTWEYTNTYTYICMHAYIHTYLRIHIQTCIHKHSNLHALAPAIWRPLLQYPCYICICVCICISIRIWVCMCIYINNGGSCCIINVCVYVYPYYIHVRVYI